MRNKRFGFTILLLVAYTAIFETWTVFSPRMVILSAVVTSLILTGFFAAAQRRKYFLNRWDVFGHAAIIADIFLEGILIRDHANRSFYLCAIAFAVVVGGFRWWLMGRSECQVAPAKARI